MSLKSINHPNLHIKCFYILQLLIVKERNTTQTRGFVSSYKYVLSASLENENKLRSRETWSNTKDDI